MGGKLILYGPGVHTGGGLVLLRSLLAAWPGDLPFTGLLDVRAEENVELPAGASVKWVDASVSGRFMAEFHLRMTAGPGDTTLCFHGLPPILPNRGKLIVFLQNRNYLSLVPLSAFSRRTATRIAVERFISRFCRSRVHGYIVQTPTMQRNVKAWFERGTTRPAPPISVVPFMEEMPPAEAGEAPDRVWDFVYVADGVDQKNHRLLLAAWIELGAAGIYPTLAFTLPPRDRLLIDEVNLARARHGVAVHNLGEMPHLAVLQLYRQSRAMIFPSLSESFGLPLVEAHQMGLPIVASERDFVRDVCVPAETFDPLSAHSITSAVRRFLGQAIPPLTVRPAAAFLQEVLSSSFCP